MPMINITVRNKIASADKSVYVCGNSDYVLKFDFDSEWNAFTSKTARIHHGATYTDVVFNGNECALPVLRDVYNFKVGVYAGNLHTTTPAVVFAKKSILCEGGLPADPASPSVYTQIMEAVGGKANSSHTHSYDDLTDKPDIPEAYDDTEVKGMIAGKADAVHTHSYNNLTDKPTIPTVDSNSIKAALGVDVVQAIDNAERQIDDLDEGKADADHVHSYNDLTNKPVIPSAYDDTEIRQDIAGKADAAHTHSYNALTDKPVIPAAYDDTAVRGLIDGLDSGKADADHVHSYDEIVDRPDAYDDAEIRASIAENKRKLDSLWALNKGISYSFETDEDEAYIKTVPSGAKSATLLEIGGKTVLQDGELISADVNAVTVRGKNILGINDSVAVTDKNGLHFTPNPDGSVTIVGTATSTYYYNIVIGSRHPEYVDIVDGASFPSSVAGIDYTERTSVNSRGETIAFSAGLCKNSSNTIYWSFRSGVTYNETRYPYIYIGGNDEYKPYTLKTYAIPSSVRTAYPLHSNGDTHDSYEMDGATWWHVQRVGDTAVDMEYPVLDAPVRTDITAMMDWDGRIAVEEGGSLTFVQSSTDMDVPSTVEYIVQADPSVDVQINGESIVQDGVANVTLDALGAERAKGEWVLKGTWTDPSGINVDFSGCTEFVIRGTVTATANTSIMTNKYRLSYNGITSARKSIFMHFIDFEFGLECIDSKGSSSAAAQSIADTINHDVWIDGSKTANINRIYVYSPDAVTSCSLQIYAR